MFQSDTDILDEIILSKNLSTETVRTIYKSVVSKLCVYQKVNYVEIDSEDKKELLYLREEIKKIQLKLAENGYK